MAESVKKEVINLAGPEFMTTDQIAKALKQILGDGEIRYKPTGPRDSVGSVISTDKAKKLLKWEPMTVLKRFIRKYVEYVKSLSFYA